MNPIDIRMQSERFVRRAARALRARARRWRRSTQPRLVNWDVTYACPMRCEHCYSESGRRASRQLSHERMMRVADVLVGMSPVPEVVFTGGEPLLVREIVAIAERLRRGGARLALYTSGSGLRGTLAADLTRLFHRIAVSIDADLPAVNDRIRGRAGAYDTAVDALEKLDRAARSTRVSLGIESTIVNSSLGHLEGLARDLPRRFPRIDFVHFGAAIPTGLASEEAYANRELLDGDALATLPSRIASLRALAPWSVRVALMDNAAFLMSTEQIRRGEANDYIAKIEADGGVRAVDIYEGVVGNILEEPFEQIWARARARHDDPEFQSHLDGVRTMADWARATRAIDRRYASTEDLARLRAR
jgi:MoaA/NifB/PqqE/SkfB family radical SAM enzyme